MNRRSVQSLLRQMIMGGLSLLALMSLGCKGVVPTGRASNSVTVFAAASLTEVFGAIKAVYERENPGIAVKLNFAGSQQLALQIQQAAVADVFVSADQRWMEVLEEQGLLSSPPRIFAGNSLLVVLPKSNSAKIARLQDLARGGVKLVLAADTVPVGRYSRELLSRLGQAPGFPNKFSAAVLRNVVSNEENVKAVLAKVELGEADAGIVYRTDVTAAASGKVDVLEIPESVNIVARYPIATIKQAANPPAAKGFVDLVLSEEGQRLLSSFGFVPAKKL